MSFVFNTDKTKYLCFLFDWNAYFVNSQKYVMVYSLVVFLCSLVLLSSTAVARDTTLSLQIYQQNDHCHSLGYGKNCTDHVGCSACHWKLNIPKWNFCIRNSTASHLPGFLFECCSQGDDPEPGPEPSPAPHAFGEILQSSACEGLAKDACDVDQGCAWCVSKAVPSQCYTKTEAMQLPAAVFECKVQQEDHLSPF